MIIYFKCRLDSFKRISLSSSKITLKESLNVIISYWQPHSVCNSDFIFKWKIQKLLIMYIGGSSIIQTQKVFSLNKIETYNHKTRSLLSYPLDRTINWQKYNHFNIIKIVHFNISLKLKQKYLFENLYFLRIYHFFIDYVALR